MNVVVRLGLVALVATAFDINPAAAQSASDLDAVSSRGARVVIDCTTMRSPRLEDVAQVVGTTYDIWATFVARQHLIKLAKPACERGTSLVEFVASAEPAVHELRVALADADVR